MVAAPVTTKDRIGLLDALRGIAVLGIVLMNIYIGGHYWETLNIQDLLRNPGSADFITTMTAQVLFEGKMRALFCLLFGAGLMLFFTQKESTGASAARLHFTRMFWLLLFGLFNAYVLFYHYDILYFYAVLGIPLFFIRKLSIKLKFLLLIPVLLYGFIMENIEYREDRIARLEYALLKKRDQKGGALAPEHRKSIRDWEEGNTPRTREDMARETEAMTGSVSEIAGIVYPKAYEKQISWFFKRMADPLALMVLGMVLFQMGFLTGKWKLNTYRGIFIMAYALGIPLTIAEIYNYTTTVHFPEVDYRLMEVQSITFDFLYYQLNRIILAIGHMALIIYAYEKGWIRELFKRFEAVGRMALTNYLVQSMILVTIFYGFGFGLFDAIGYWELFLIPLFIAILQLWYSPLWLRYFRFGPFEWLWRSLTYGKQQPFRKEQNHTKYLNT